MNQAYEQVMDYIYVIGMGTFGVCALVGWVWNRLRGAEKDKHGR